MTAIISPCGLYRYRLERQVGPSGPVYAFFGVNPSTADASLDDATVRKWIGFTTRWGASKFVVGNVFAYRSTEVGNLMTATDPGGPENWDQLRSIVADADILVPCWGDRKKVHRDLHPYFDAVKGLLKDSGKPVMHFGLTKDGDPKHPLMLGYKTFLVVGMP